MSPGDGVWSSPSRGLLHDGDQIVPELHRRNKVEEVSKALFHSWFEKTNITVKLVFYGSLSINK